MKVWAIADEVMVMRDIARLGVLGAMLATMMTPAWAQAADLADANGDTSLQETCTNTQMKVQKDFEEGGGCFVTGTLAVPFKFELTKNRDVQSSASLGGVVGYRFSSQPLVPTPFIFAGLSTTIGSQTGVTTEKSGTTSTTMTSSTASGVSYGLGALWPIGGTFQPVKSTPTANVSQAHVGILVGFDHVSNTSHYEYNDRPWISFVVGVSF